MLELKPRDSLEINMKRLFMFFLKENNIYSSYVYNMEKFKNILDPKLCCHHYICHGNTLLTEAFVWSKTIEGYDFWYDLNNKWYRYKKFNNLKFCTI